jgi:hypothetical protein
MIAISKAFLPIGLALRIFDLDALPPLRTRVFWVWTTRRQAIRPFAIPVLVLKINAKGVFVTASLIPCIWVARRAVFAFSRLALPCLLFAHLSARAFIVAHTRLGNAFPIQAHHRGSLAIIINHAPRLAFVCLGVAICFFF